MPASDLSAYMAVEVCASGCLPALQVVLVGREADDEGKTIMLELEITCSNHDSMKRERRLSLVIDGPKDLKTKVLKKRIEQHEWIVQLNGDNMDTYCSKKCAE